ncbi:MAG: Protein GrpE [Candidatus Levybacteria bacterium GW2011_GWA1_39_32]|nr:MAG: Protein GrpE [Candidatus Levybacteria bacterium GW2011_GWA1_39_32]
MDKAKSNNLKNQLARALADYDNLRKRVEREREDLEKLAGLKLILRILPILDNLKTAQNYLKDAGLAITIGELENILKDEGVEEIKPNKGDNFDHNLHEVTEVVENCKEKNKIEEVVLSGWKFREGPVIRYAKIKICQK